MRVIDNADGRYITKENNVWSAHILSTEIGLKFTKNNFLVINQTWIRQDAELIVDMIKEWLDANVKNRAMFISTFDPSWVDKDLELNKLLQQKVDTSKIKYITSKELCFWLIAVDRFFLNYNLADVQPKEFTNNFLCYQRKNTEERDYLYDQLCNKKGVVTIGKKLFPEINSNLPDHNGYKEIRHMGLSRPEPNDIWSLGNIDVWNSSFLNIVSETKQRIQYPFPFVSEKIFKPIIGLRPFVCYGNPNTSSLLRSLGFETFDEEFEYNPTIDYKKNAEQLVNIVEKLDNINKSEMFNNLLPKLIHNKEHLKKAALVEWDKINILTEI